MAKKKPKPFYIVSALIEGDHPIGERKRLETEAEAIERAKWIITKREEEGRSAMEFYVLKVTKKVGREKLPFYVEKF